MGGTLVGRLHVEGEEAARGAGRCLLAAAVVGRAPHPSLLERMTGRKMGIAGFR